MNYKRKIFKSLRYTCLLAVIALGLVTIIGTGGSSDSGSSNGSVNGGGRDDASLEPLDELTSKELAGLVDDEEAAQVMAAEFTGDDLKLQFKNGAAFTLPADANYNSGLGEVVISLLRGERFFNTDEDIVFDLSETEHAYYIDFELDLPPGLEVDDIAVFLYSPGSSKEEVDLILVEFDYDPASGKLSAFFNAPMTKVPPIMLTPSSHSHTMIAHSPYSKVVRTASNSNSQYTRLAVSYALRMELADGPVGNTIPMPYYQQSENTCWAAVTKMMARAYAPVDDRNRIIRLHDIVRYMGHSDFDGGMGKWAFTRHVPAYLQSRTGVEFEGSTFLRTRALESKIMRLINQDRPVILNLKYPGVGQHQILVIGYEWELVGDREDRATFRLLYHDPQGEQVGATTIDKYRWNDFDWLMKDKWPFDTVQIVYADQSPPSARTLQTLATPIYNKSLWNEGQAVGNLHFYNSRIHMVYNRAEPHGYSWAERRSDNMADVIPAEDTHVIFTQKIYNAAENTTYPILLIEAYDMGGGGKLFEERQNLVLRPGRTLHDFEIDLEDFFADEEREVLVILQLQENYLFLDGYDFRFTLAPKEEDDLLPPSHGESWRLTEIRDFSWLDDAPNFPDFNMADGAIYGMRYARIGGPYATLEPYAFNFSWSVPPQELVPGRTYTLEMNHSDEASRSNSNIDVFLRTDGHSSDLNRRDPPLDENWKGTNDDKGKRTLIFTVPGINVDERRRSDEYIRLTLSASVSGTSSDGFNVGFTYRKLYFYKSE